MGHIQDAFRLSGLFIRAMKRLLLAPFLSLGLLGAAATPAGAQVAGCYSDAQIRTAVQSGQVVSLSTLLSLIQARVGGQVVSSRLCVVNGRPTYLVNMLTGGQVREVRVDAANGAIL